MTMDLAPTLLAAAGARGGNYDGMNLMPFITGQRTPVQRTVCWRYKRAEVVRIAIRHGDWKYADDAGLMSLHNVASDPREERDLSTEEPEIVKDLRTRLRAWEKEVEAPRLRGFRPA
jgi:arylsulfatase A-like enzyme